MGNQHSVLVVCFSSRVCLLLFVLWGLIMPPLVVGQRSVTYSANIGSFAIQAAKGSGESCLWTGTALTKLKADNSVAYAIQRSSLSVVAVGIDAPGNCYLAVQNGSVSVLKFHSSGSADPTFTTFVLPGSVAPQVKAMVVDVSGNIYLAGSTTNTIDFPEVANAQNSYAGGLSDGFVLKIAADGSHLIYSTYLGGSSADVVNCRGFCRSRLRCGTNFLFGLSHARGVDCRGSGDAATAGLRDGTRDDTVPLC